MRAVIKNVTSNVTGIDNVEKYVGQIIDVVKTNFCEYQGRLPKASGDTTYWYWFEDWLDFTLEGLGKALEEAKAYAEKEQEMLGVDYE